MRGGKENQGIIPLSLEYINQVTQHDPNIKVQLKISYIEIYNEQVNDLLDSSKKNLAIQVLKSSEKNGVQNIIIKDLT